MSHKKTIYDIAEEVGVSPATVSRTLSGTGYVSEETKQKVLSAAQGFQPRKKNQISNDIRTPSHTIGLVISHNSSYFFTNSVYSDIMNGICEYVTPYGYTLLLDTRNPKIDSLISHYKLGKVDGYILLGLKNSSTGNEILTGLITNDIPFVLVGDYVDEFAIPPYSKIDIDDFSASKDATDYLINLGHKKISFVANSMDFASTYNRYLGYKFSLEDSDLKCESKYIISMNNQDEEGYVNMAKHMLSQQDAPTAIVVCNHILCVSVCQAISELGLSIPNDISVISFDDAVFNKYYNPPITSIWQPSEEKGRLAAETILAAIEKKSMPTKVFTLQSMIIYRSSCTVPKK